MDVKVFISTLNLRIPNIPPASLWSHGASFVCLGYFRFSVGFIIVHLSACEQRVFTSMRQGDGWSRYGKRMSEIVPVKTFQDKWSLTLNSSWMSKISKISLIYLAHFWETALSLGLISVDSVINQLPLSRKTGEVLGLKMTASMCSQKYQRWTMQKSQYQRGCFYRGRFSDTGQHSNIKRPLKTV